MRNPTAIARTAGLLASLLALPLQGASAVGTSLWGGLDGDVLDEIVHTRFGSLMLLRAGAWALLGGILLVAAARSRGPNAEPATPPGNRAVVLV